MSAGLVGSPGLGYSKDRFSGEALKAAAPASFDELKNAQPSKFLFFGDVFGLDGKKLGAAHEKLNEARKTAADSNAALATLSPDEKALVESSITGDRKTLVADSFIPATMAVIYLALMIYFKAIGGYKAVKIEDEKAAA